MGLNLNRWVRDRKRDIADVFDANSQRDQAKRVAQGQPRMYADQQAQQRSAPTQYGRPQQFQPPTIGPPQQRRPSPLGNITQPDITAPTEQLRQQAQINPTQPKSDVFNKTVDTLENVGRGISNLTPQNQVINRFKAVNQVARDPNMAPEERSARLKELSRPRAIVEDLVPGGGVGADLIREVGPRGGARILESLAQNKVTKNVPIFPGVSPNASQLAGAVRNAQKTGVGKFILGDKPVETSEKDLQNMVGNTPVLKDLAKFGPVAFGAGVAMNVPGVGGLDDAGKAAKAISQANNVEDVAKVVAATPDLEKVISNVDDAKKAQVLEDLAKEKNPENVKKIVQEANSGKPKVTLKQPDPLESLKQEARTVDYESINKAQDEAKSFMTQMIDKYQPQKNGQSMKITDMMSKSEKAQMDKLNKAADDLYTQSQPPKPTPTTLQEATTNTGKPKVAFKQPETTDYRSTHQIDSQTSRNVGDLKSVDEDVNTIKSKYGLSNYDRTDLNRLKKIAGNPDAEVKIYRASPLNQLNDGDWVTTSKTYANDIKRQNGGTVYEHTVRAGDLNLPRNIEDNPSLARFSAFQYSKADSALAPKLEKLTPEARANQGVPETPEAFKMDGGTPNPTAGADSPIVMSGGGRSNIPETVKPARTDEQIVFGDAPKFEERGTSTAQKLSPDKYIRENITRPLTEAKRKVAFKAQTSSNPFARAYARTAQGISRESVVPEAVLQQKRYLRGGVEKGKLVREGIADLGEGVSVESKARVWAALDPEQAKRLGITVDPATFTPDEKAYFDVLDELTKFYTQGNLERGFIDEKQAANADWFKRGYSVFEEGSDQSKAYNQTRQAILNQYKGRKQVSEDLINQAITDPGYLMAKKAAESHAAWAMSDYGKFLNSEGIASDVKLPGTRQLPNSKLFGEAAGKYVPTNIAEDFTGFEYNNGVINAFNDMITAYDRIGLRQAKKQLLTVFNPAVRGGNQISNRVFFANMTGINPVQFNRNYVRAGKEISGKGQLYREAVEQGLTGIDITQAEFAKRISQYMEDPGALRQANDWVKSSYSAADDKARVAAYITHRERGLSPEEAARLTQRGFQDYKSVGFFYDMAAKTPLIGNAFVRFAGDAVRIAKNAALDHPLRSVATIAMWSAFVNGMSVASGESTAGAPGDSNLTKAKNLVTGANKSEDQQTREDRFGAPKIPFTDISMTVQTPWGEVNVARFMPFYQLNDVQNAYTRFLPLQESPIRFEDGKPVSNGPGFSDPLLGQVAQVIIDKDFRNKSIRDPENTGQFSESLDPKQQAKNVARFLGTQNLPLGRETDTIASAATGNPDVYGKERTLPQAILRSGGIKVEQFGKEQASKQRDKNTYFKEKEQLDKEIATLPPGEQEVYKRLTGYYKLRQEVPNEFEPGKNRQKKTPVFNFPEDKWKDYTSNPGIYEKLRQKKVAEAEKGAPLQPEFDDRLSDTFRKQLINNKSLAPGEDVEADERMYSNPEWDTYQKLKDEYKAKAGKYYPDNGDDYVDELVKHKAADFPKKGAAKEAYDKAYGLYSEGKGPKPAFTDAVAADKEAYSNAKLQWTNAERKARGLGPIDKKTWDNVTFGFESDEEKVYKQLKYGKGYGGYGYGKGGGKGKDSAGDPYKYAIDLNAGGKVVKPNVRVADIPKPKVAKKGTSKPKVTLKKSKV